MKRTLQVYVGNEGHLENFADAFEHSERAAAQKRSS
jgi:hypothetical protein